jgi:hypothetical protein
LLENDHHSSLGEKMEDFGNKIVSKVALTTVFGRGGGGVLILVLKRVTIESVEEY